MSYKVLLVLALTVLVIRAGPLPTESVETEAPLRRVRRIIGGDFVESKDFPYMVSVQATLNQSIFAPLVGGVGHFCGGTLISASWVLTAAHCMYAFDKNNTRLPLVDSSIWQVRLGTKVLRPSTAELFESRLKSALNNFLGRPRYKLAYYPVDKVFLHPLYEDSILEHDLALLKLKKPIPLAAFKNDIKTLLPAFPQFAGANFPPDNMNCTALGWGSSCPSCLPEANLKAVRLPVIPHAACVAAFDTPINLTQSLEFCAGFINGTSSTGAGDSGGPLVCEFQGRKMLAGVTSAGHATEPQSHPVIFTRVAAYTKWILEILRNN